MFVRQNFQNKNLWQESSKEHIAFKPLKTSVTTDIAIIGGGYTGCSAALFAANNGLSVSLIDKKIGYGGSGRNVGLVNAGLWLPPEKVEKILGVDAGSKLNKALAKTPDLVFDLIDKYDIKCSANRSGTLHCAHSQNGLKDIQKRYQQLSSRGAELELLDRQQTNQRIGSLKFFGALFNKSAGTINPLNYCIGLARAAQSKGANIYESTLATKIQSSNNHWLVDTPDGSIKAKMLLIATNAYQQPIKGIKSPEYTGVHYFQVATNPLPEKTSNMILPNGEGCWDTASVMSSFRLDEDNRFIVGGVGNLGHRASKIHTNWAKRKMESLFPQLKNTPIEYSWHGRIAMTGNHIPKIIKLGNNAYSVFGYSGRGIGPGTYFGKAITDCFLNGNEDSLPVTPVNQNKEHFSSIKSKIFELGATSSHLI
jgi:glycine/D-amino acid oxidase-like deaminating enzyme